jgi:hypothetical protein
LKLTFSTATTPSKAIVTSFMVIRAMRHFLSAVRPDGLEVKGILAGQVVKVNYHRQGWEAEKAAFEREKLTALVERELVNRGLAPEFAAFLTGADEAESLMRIEAFEGLFQEALRRELTRRLGDLSAPREPSKQRGFTRERLRQMSAGEINRNWEEIQRTLKG